MSRTAEYRAWKQMYDRCYNKKNKMYADYGGRGIGVHPSWVGAGTFELFFAEVGRRPSGKHSLDRRDNDKDYEPGNVRWATKEEQARNKRNNVMLSYAGTTQCLAEWARCAGLDAETLSSRLEKGWPLEQALLTPASRRLVSYAGETLPLAEWARRLRVPFGVLRYRLAFWPLEKAMTATAHDVRGGPRLPRLQAS
jgi:lambda repressor-like predicted transcriptional regulator